MLSWDAQHGRTGLRRILEASFSGVGHAGGAGVREARGVLALCSTHMNGSFEMQHME